MSQNKESAVILVVDDDPLLLKTTTFMLEHLHYKVICAEHPEQALSYLRDTDVDVDLLLTDVVMPEMGGRQLAESALNVRPGLHVLFMTGFMADEVLHKSVMDGVYQAVVKPFDSKELDGKIRLVLNGSGEKAT